MNNNCMICETETKTPQAIYCSLACSNRSRTAKNKEKYNLNPRRCKCCNEPIPYEKRYENKLYCSSSCAAKLNNLGISRRKKKSKIIKEDNSPHTQAMNRFLIGELKHRDTIRRCLVETVGNFCFNCKQEATWDNKPLVMVVDHIDGNAGNNSPINLRLLCPNCNSQSPTFCGRNKGSGRQSRGMSKYA